MPILQILVKIFKILRSEGTPSQIAIGFTMGTLAGLLPMNTLHVLLIWLAAIVFNISFGAFLFAFILFSGIAYLLDPFFHSIGYAILVDLNILRSLWVTLYTAPIFPLTRFYNTVVMGATVTGLMLSVPEYFAVKFFILNYREKVDARMQKWKIIKIIKASKLFQLYEKLKKWSE